ncbi:hypothetical protein GCM10027066_04020 [Dyella jejuensis]
MSSSAPPSSASRQRNDGAFQARLQDARQENEASSSDKSDASSSTKATSGQGGTSAAGTAKPGADPSAQDAAQQDDADSDSTLAVPDAISLASAVLHLIDHAVGDSGSHGAPVASATKSTQQTIAKHAAPSQPAGLMAPLPLPTTAAVSNGNADAGAAIGGATGGAAASSSALLLHKAFANAADSGAGDADSGAASALGDASAAAQGGSADPTQALAGALSAASHVAIASTAAAPAAAAATPGGADVSALAGLGAVSNAMPAATASTGHSLGMNAPVGSSGFAKELGQQVTWLSGQEVKQAQIRLNPQDLGPLDVKVSVEHGRVDVAFMTQHPAATAAVQQGLGQLSQMLGGHGLSLGHTSVGQQAQQQFSGHQQAQDGSRLSNDGEDPAEVGAIGASQRVAIGLVDAFA